MDEMRSLWRWLDGNGFDWISAWDHIYEAPPEGGTIPHFEAVATLAALACDTTNARLGCLVFYVGYRNPGLLAKAAITIDHLAGGRFELGLGAGWHQWEAEAYGYEFPPAGVRLDMLAEAVELTIGLVNGSSESEGLDNAVDPHRTSFGGQHFSLADASCLPAPIYGSLPIWIGGRGRNRTLPLAAQWANGWNAAYISSADYADLNQHLSRLCEGRSRDPGEIERSVNLIFAMGADQSQADAIESSFLQRWGPMAERVKGGALLGAPDRAMEQIMGYVEAGADLVNIAIRVPYDEEALEAYCETVMPAVRAAAG